MYGNFLETWKNLQKLASKSYTCWYCGENIASECGYDSIYNGHYTGRMAIYICHHCNAPSIFDTCGNYVMPVPFGKNIKKLPKEVEDIYNEARLCISIGAYTSTVMLLRKILMNLAVVNGAKVDSNFKEYVDYLCENGFVHKKQTQKAHMVRTMGNEANHKIENKTKEEAEQIFKFVEFLLLNNYEFADEEDNNET